MNTFKKMWAIFLIMVISLLTTKVYAIEAIYFDNIVFNDNTEMTIEPYRGSMGYLYYIEVSTGGAGKLEFDIVGIDLTMNKNYIVKLTSDFVNEEKTFTGEELTNGATITILDGKSTISIKVHEEGNEATIPYKYQRDCTGMQGYCDDTLYMEYLYQIHFDEQRDYSELDAKFNQIAPNGIIKLNCIDPGESVFADSMITAALNKKYSVNECEIYGDNYEGEGHLQLQCGDKNKNYDVTYQFASANKAAKDKVEEVANKLQFTHEDIMKNYNKRFVVEDLESINYIYNMQNVDDAMVALNSIVNYASAIHKLADNSNIDFVFDPRMGGSESDFYNMNVGPLDILYDGVVYNYVEPVGYALSKIIYIPDDTQKTREAFIKAAKDRIETYLKGVNVEITYAGDIALLDEAQYSWEKYDPETQTLEYIKLFNLDQTNGEWYNITIGDTEYPYFIVLDSEKMNTPYVKTVDVNTNVYIMTESYAAPLDSRISASKLSESSDEYKEISKKLNIIKGLAYDLNLYSNSLDMYISKLNDGNFKVYIPVDANTAKKNLIAVYLKEDGTIEQHPVKIENNYAVFETNHFSTYALVEDTDNPKTVDNIYLYIIILAVGLIGFISSVLYLKNKKSKKRK